MNSPRVVDLDHPWVLVHLSDVHIPPVGTLPDTALDPSARLVAALEGVARFNPDHMVITGDLTDTGSAEEYGRLAAILAHAPCPITVIGGNHDVRERLVAAIDGAPETRGLGAVVDTDHMRIVLVESALEHRRDGTFTAERLEWLDAALGEQPSKPTVVATHHPPLSTGTWWMDYRGPAGSESLEAVVGRHPQVQRVLAGHLHRAIDAPFAHTICSVSGPLVLAAEPALGSDDGPMLSDEPALVHVLRWDGTRLLGFRCPVEVPRRRVSLADLIKPWEPYAADARSGRPMYE